MKKIVTLFISSIILLVLIMGFTSQLTYANNLPVTQDPPQSSTIEKVEETQTINTTENFNEERNISFLESEQFKIPILMYHHLSEDSSKWNSGVVSPDKFREDMLYLTTLGYTTIHFGEYIDFLENGSTLPDNPILITFDDGYYSNYEYAYPILKKYNMKATFLIIGWSVGRTTFIDSDKPIIPHFSWEEAKEMYDSGLVDIQHHTYDLHSPEGLSYGYQVPCSIGVDKIPNETQEEYEARFIADTIKLKNMIEEKIGNDVFVYAYPYGVHNETTEKLLQDLGFKVSLTTISGITDIKDSLIGLKRIHMPSDMCSIDLFKNILSEQGQDIFPFSSIEEQPKRIESLEKLLGY